MKAARKSLGLTQDALANMAGATSNRGLQDNEAGKSMPGGQMIRALARAGINANWLLTGEGTMTLPQVAYQDTPAATALIAAEPVGVRSSDINPLLLQGVVDFLFTWLAEHDVVIDRAKYGPVIAVLYRVASTRGRVEIHELEQVMKLAA